ncbi:DUF2155 domain-containing protein [Haematospirillum jordaniae]|uniref:DUF2155 domain-containing protein n=1 Tax=Haematospirillum jordaniae TaxID=1549855 RepID=UPI0009EDA9C8|nr:DUF2155 domain-containing protein [Haematospirillum jordaniae]NKD45162.1 DUF2155 domain-containing protein [Haematospirillum jordaniae]NKD56253.1 DUF2155 domain-containing protein [Haematospirillum jordaniae]NKD58310.1 DUF2155 domain-containing protein [Haematospirillum jordaniae]NKD66519.1 DUF2155 domain-containing protein [Haematospirillum jordaniae]NKD78313.1 DUF2155 domain-containing protein [Haematospirillum jordaniae]
MGALKGKGRTDFLLRALCALVVTVSTAVLVVAPSGAAETIERRIAVLRWLDKAAARVQTMEVEVNRTFQIQALQIIARACVERPPEEPPESAVFLDVWENKANQPAVEVFRGWMYASSPGLSAMEHPVYDIWVLDCKE